MTMVKRKVETRQTLVASQRRSQVRKMTSPKTKIRRLIRTYVPVSSQPWAQALLKWTLLVMQQSASVASLILALYSCACV